jgi:hypothetical protein
VIPGRAEEAWPEAGRTTSRANSASENLLPIGSGPTMTSPGPDFHPRKEGTSGAVPNLTA